ncbi:hypothetical protein Syun_023083 [Stephania yunnanensis]|uniref:WDR11 second beta-propeller domain-containing protein n=1 Tax=Stephania yunnanensis TaxID=152371 RepID=A0AAP0FGN7_9MAGN
MSSTSRDWMYNRLDNGFVRIEFAVKVKEFISFAKQHRENGDEGPQNFYQMDNHIDYADVGGDDPTTYGETLHNVAGPSFNWNHVEESPNPQARQLYDMIEASSEQLWSGYETMTTLSAMARLLAIKSEHHIFERGYNEIIKFVKDCLPNDDSLVENFYATKRLMRGLGLPVEKIDCCEDQCMIYWGVGSELTSCKFCGKSCYIAHRRGRGRNTKKCHCKKMYYFPLGPRLQRLYASESTAKHMRWHGDHSSPEDVMQHCSDSIAWRHFNDFNRDFVAEVRNVRLGLCTDGFQANEKAGGYNNKLVVTRVRSGLNRIFRVMQKPERAPIRALRASSSGRFSSVKELTCFQGCAVINAAESGASFPLKRRDLMLDYILTLMGREESDGYPERGPISSWQVFVMMPDVGKVELPYCLRPVKEQTLDQLIKIYGGIFYGCFVSYGGIADGCLVFGPI